MFDGVAKLKRLPGFQSSVGFIPPPALLLAVG